MTRTTTGSVARFLLLSAVLTGSAASVAAAVTARELLDQARRLSETTRKWTDRTQRLHLLIVDRHGGERKREMVIQLKKYPEDRTRTMLFFEAPQEVKGVGFMQWADPHAQDEQWLYLPELKRVRKISGGAKHESFVGTDFSYDDLALITQITDWTENDARSALVRGERFDDESCHVIEFTPTGKDLTYGKILVWLRAKDLVVLKYEMYDKAGKLEKDLHLTDVRNIGTIPSAFHMEMRNVQAGSHTVVEFSEMQYDAGLDDGLFTQRALEHGL